MNLLVAIKPETLQALGIAKDELWYCVPWDIGVSKIDGHDTGVPDGQFISDGYVAVTKTRLLVICGKRLVYEFPLSACASVSTDTMRNNGALVITKKDGSRLRTVRFSMKYMIQFSYLARGANLLVHGVRQKVESREREIVCPTCGYVLPGTRICPRCSQKKQSKRRLLALSKPYILRFLLLGLLMVIVSGVQMLMPKVQQQFIDRALVGKHGTLGDIGWFLTVMLVLTVVSIGFTVTKSWYSTRLGAQISSDLREKLFCKLQQLSLSYIQEQKPGELMNRILNDTFNIRRFMETVFADTVPELISMVFAIVVMGAISWKLLLISLVFFPIVVWSSFRMRGPTMENFRRAEKRRDQLESGLQDVISGISVVKAYGKEREEAGKFRDLAEGQTRMEMKNELYFAIRMPVFTFLFGLGVYFATYFGGVQVIAGTLTPGVLMQFVSYTRMLYAPMRRITVFVRQLTQTTASLNRICDVLDAQEEIVDTPESKAWPITGAVEFRDVTFGYKSYEPVLNNINLTVRPGEMIGLVGASGSGKTTFINLLMRLYPVDDGELCIDGININDIQLESLHRQIGVVLQETFLFNGTILENIRYARPEATFEEVVEAAVIANAHDFICHAPDGYETYVGEKGYMLSGGERQRIAIARAVLNRPRLLILDEATSNLDTESEYLVQTALERVRKGCTTFAIAHRLSTLKSADRLIVIDNHRIAEMGSHEELIAKKGIYYGLVTAQLEMSKVS